MRNRELSDMEGREKIESIKHIKDSWSAVVCSKALYQIKDKGREDFERKRVSSFFNALSLSLADVWV